MEKTEDSGGFTLLEVIIGVAILGVLSLFIVGAIYPVRMSIRQAENETLASNMAFAVLEAIRAEAEDLDLDGNVTVNDLDLTDPDRFQIMIQSDRDVSLPDIYQVNVRVEVKGMKGGAVTMCTLIRKCSG
ncbi:MAG: Tfp pilus assembly protein FimT/FimU [Deltaproteobacteria bacterium]